MLNVLITTKTTKVENCLYFQGKLKPMMEMLEAWKQVD